jgi:hypothetical protein
MRTFVLAVALAPTLGRLGEESALDPHRRLGTRFIRAAYVFDADSASFTTARGLYYNGDPGSDPTCNTMVNGDELVTDLSNYKWTSMTGTFSQNDGFGVAVCPDIGGTASASAMVSTDPTSPDVIVAIYKNSEWLYLFSRSEMLGTYNQGKVQIAFIATSATSPPTTLSAKADNACYSHDSLAPQVAGKSPKFAERSTATVPIGCVKYDLYDDAGCDTGSGTKRGTTTICAEAGDTWIVAYHQTPAVSRRLSRRRSGQPAWPRQRTLTRKRKMINTTRPSLSG